MTVGELINKLNKYAYDTKIEPYTLELEEKREQGILKLVPRLPYNNDAYDQFNELISEIDYLSNLLKDERRKSTKLTLELKAMRADHPEDIVKRRFNSRGILNI